MYSGYTTQESKIQKNPTLNCTSESWFLWYVKYSSKSLLEKKEERMPGFKVWYIYLLRLIFGQVSYYNEPHTLVYNMVKSLSIF